jgi:hypothetical protein
MGFELRQSGRVKGFEYSWIRDRARKGNAYESEAYESEAYEVIILINKNM